MTSINELLELAKTTAKKAGKFILQESKKDFKVSLKSARDVVTEVDLASEKIIIESIKAAFPKHAILAEESGANEQESDYKWIIDPLDGTTNFSHRHPFYAVSIGLEHEGEVIVGAVYAPRLDELFYASKDQGAFLNGKPIHVSKVDKMESSLISTGFPPRNREQNLKLISRILPMPQAIRRCGAASIDLCFIACGRYEVFWELGLHSWDVAAGSLIIQEAGGKVTNLDGSKLDLEGKSILSSNSLMHEIVQNLLS